MVEEPTRTIRREQAAPPPGFSLEHEISQLADAAIDIAEEIDTVSGEDASLEDIERAKARAAEFLDKYKAVFNRLAPDQAKKLSQEIGRVVERIQKALVQLKEAPE